MNENNFPQAPDFDFVRPIGEGGFGQVWLAINRTTGQPRAVKVIPRIRAGNLDPAGREVASLTRLEANLCHRHSNLLAIHHVGETAEHLFYVMDLADDLSGQADPTHPDYRPATLDNLLAAGPLDADKCQHYAVQLLSALACLHEAGMVHRDVKPANCLFVGGELKLGDFGLLTAASLTVSRLGTLRYMPPDGCMDARADVFAAGLVIYEMTTGLGAERFPSLGPRVRAISEDRRLGQLNRLALRACDPDPSRRFRNAQEMLAELTAVERSSAGSRRIKRLALVGLIVIVAALVFLWPRLTDLVGGNTDRVSVNFVTDLFEATIYLDGQLLYSADGDLCHTPCTVAGLSAQPHHVVFQWTEETDPLKISGPDRKKDAGMVDFSKHRQVNVQLRGK
jgi:eukaryotic-like serine/threonine-protein kinase